jgi:hypothetical protein
MVSVPRTKRGSTMRWPPTYRHTFVKLFLRCCSLYLWGLQVLQKVYIIFRTPSVNFLNKLAHIIVVDIRVTRTSDVWCYAKNSKID